MKGQVVKAVLRVCAIGLILSSLGVGTAYATFEVSASLSIHAETDFYEPLATSGAWIEVGGYGRCWHPSRVSVEWRPYCYGHWVWTDCGWYWESDEPWAWACYHYGSWVYDPVYFWLWVPGVEWAPAWVTWRVGGGYIGWAPLAPARFSVAVAAPSFVFVETHRFEEPLRPSAVIVNNTRIINQTTVINNITRETRSVGGAPRQKVVVVHGPDPSVVEKATGKRLKAAPIQEVVRRTKAPVIATSKAVELRPKEKTSFNAPVQTVPSQERKAAAEYKPAPEHQERKVAPEYRSAPEYKAPEYKAPEQRAAPEYRTAPEHKGVPEPKAAPEYKGGSGQLAPARPPAQAGPSEKPSKHGDEKGGGGGGKGHEQEGDHHGKEQP